MLFSQTVLSRVCGEFVPSNFLPNKISASLSVSCCFWSVSTSMSFKLLFLCFQSMSGFLEFDVFEDGFAITCTTEMAFDTC